MTSAYAHPEALCSLAWLEEHLYDPAIRILDGSFHLPNSGRDPRDEYAAAHIPGAVFFDIDAVADPATFLPHMRPDAATFAAAAGSLGIDEETPVIVYDQPGSFAAARVWWTFRSFGHEAVAVLDGGLAAWLAAGFPVTDAVPMISPRDYTARPSQAYVRSAADVQRAIGQDEVQIIDNRPAGRYAGRDPEPRPVRHLGHVPGARSLPFPTFLDMHRNAAWRPADELAAAFELAGVDLDRPVIAYCGSGVSACSTAFAAYLLGSEAVAVYDGSWAEWGNRDDLPVDREDS